MIPTWITSYVVPGVLMVYDNFVDREEKITIHEPQLCPTTKTLVYNIMSC